MSKKPTREKPLREKDVALLTRISKGEGGNIWRQPLLNAVKRAGAEVRTDEKHRLVIVFGAHALHPGRLDIGLSEDFPTPFRQQLCALASDLLAHRTHMMAGPR